MTSPSRQEIEDLPGVEPDSDEALFDTSELETAGTETEDDISGVDTIDFRDVVLAPSDWTVQTILTQLSDEAFELDPDFQRRNAWTDARKSKFIESLLLGLPIPQLVFAERETSEGDSHYIVIDGKQRLLALEAFHAETNPLRLGSLTVLTQLNGYTRQELLDDPTTRALARRLDNRTIRTVVIRRWPRDEFLHLVFHRINHQTLALSAQELRQALHPGPFTKFADRFAGASEDLHRILGTSKRPDFRMRDVELLVRHIAYHFRITDYQGNLKKFLDDTCMHFNGSWAEDEERVVAAADAAVQGIRATETVFGDHAFRRYSGSNQWENRFNRAVFDVMLYFFVDADVAEAAAERAESVVDKFRHVSETDRKFAQSMASTTKTLPNTAYRLETWGKALVEVLELDLVIPTLPPNARRIQLTDVPKP